MLGCNRLSLLFKASVHGYTGNAFHQKCHGHQGHGGTSSGLLIHVSSQANTGRAGTSLTTQARKDGKPLPITICDTMGLDDGVNTGLDIDDFQLNPSMPLRPESPSFCEEPSLKDRIHIVVYVIGTGKLKLLSNKMIEKLAAFRRKANQMGN
ncbi:hypothetical protein SRHO_G00015890 [Serrasalmus rhombeus]